MEFNDPQSLLRRRLSLGLLSLPAASALTACSDLPRRVAEAVLPDPPPYPAFTNKAEVEAQAQRMSDVLEAHILRWLQGAGPAEIPLALMPPGLSDDITNIRLVGPDTLTAAQQWIVRPAELMRPGDVLNFERLRGYYPDPHVTYAVPGVFVLPFGTEVVLEGEFPRARFFDVQVSPPFDPAFYYYGGMFGAPEVPIVDIDIDPLAGHVNPFRVGADRNATRRSYRIELTMVRGNGVALEPAYREPYFRAPGNRRLGSAIQYQGPLGRKGMKGGHGRGEWDGGTLWLRYYAPDSAAGPLAGVALPSVHYRLRPELRAGLPNGGRFYITCEHSKRTLMFNREHKARVTAPAEPDPASMGPSQGWGRSLDIFEDGIAAIFQRVGKTSEADKAQGRALIRGLVARGAELPAPGYYMSSNSRVPYISYLGRGMSLGPGRILVLTGTLPRFPRTRAGEARMGSGQVRYFSITTYPEPDWLDLDWIGIPHSSVMDDEIVTDAQGRYVIVWSRPQDRPRNANAAAGVTWLDWGPAATQGLVIRWMSVHADWRDPRTVPDSTNISYRQASWFHPEHDPSILGHNDQSGLLRHFQPVVRYPTRASFEALGSAVIGDRAPIWSP
jgi:hypothetical protein